MVLVAEQLVASSESSGFPSFICLKQEQGRASIRAGDLTTNYSVFVGPGEISNYVGVIQHLNIGLGECWGTNLILRPQDR